MGSTTEGHNSSRVYCICKVGYAGSCHSFVTIYGRLPKWCIHSHFGVPYLKSALFKLFHYFVFLYYLFICVITEDRIKVLRSDCWSAGDNPGIFPSKRSSSLFRSFSFPLSICSVLKNTMFRFGVPNRLFIRRFDSAWDACPHHVTCALPISLHRLVWNKYYIIHWWQYQNTNIVPVDILEQLKKKTNQSSVTFPSCSENTIG